MKQSDTVKNQMTMFEKFLVDPKCSDGKSSLPGKHIVNNIMNYSRSLQVLKRKNGKAFLLLTN